jgi:hypothetical protein
MREPDWWREIWSLDDGPSRIFCGIARTEDGYAVDVFRGDTCIESETYPTRIEAAFAVDLFRRRYIGDSPFPATPFTAGATALAASDRS